MRKVPKALRGLKIVPGGGPRQKYYRAQRPDLLKPCISRPTKELLGPIHPVYARPQKTWIDFLRTLGDGNLSRGIDDCILIALHLCDYAPLDSLILHRCNSYGISTIPPGLDLTWSLTAPGSEFARRAIDLLVADYNAHPEKYPD